MKKAVILAGGATLILIAAAAAASAAQAPEDIPAVVRTLFKDHCVRCHRGRFPPQGLSWEPERIAAAIDAPSRERPDLMIIDTSDPEASYLLKKVRGEDGIVRSAMPPDDPLKKAEIAILSEWIAGLRQSAGRDPWAAPPSAGTIFGSSGGGNGPGQDQEARERPFDKPAFWGTRLINLPTTMTMERRDVLFRISHRFLGPVDEGIDTFFGLDSGANTLFSLGYGLTDRLGITVGRARLYQEWEFGLSWLAVEQGMTAGLPFSAALHAGLDWVTLEGSAALRLNFQVSLSHQLTRRLSFLVVPAFTTNSNFLGSDPEGTLALGLGGRWMALNDLSLILEWVPVLAGYKDVENGWGVGIEKKIGGHVFQLFFANSYGLAASQYLPGGELRLGDFDFRFGFNIFRTF
jgi:hypothetical protein